MSTISTSDFPQADRISSVVKLVKAVHMGVTTEDELELAIELDSDGRQARYYRRSAVALGLLEMEEGVPQLTKLGALLASSNSEERDDILRLAVANSVVFDNSIKFIENSQPDLKTFKQYFRSLYPGSPGTADRRISSALNYLTETNLVSIKDGHLHLRNFQSSPVEPTLRRLVDGLTDDQENSLPAKKTCVKRTVGYIADPKLRKAIEVQAVAQGIHHYRALGYSVEDVGATMSFDLRLNKADEERHVEVKGSQREIEKCILTVNEVLHAREYANTDLVLVSNIRAEYLRDNDKWITHEGTVRVITDWTPANSALSPLSFSYDLVFEQNPTHSN